MFDLKGNHLILIGGNVDLTPDLFHMIIYRPERNFCRYQRENTEAVKQEDRQYNGQKTNNYRQDYLLIGPRKYNIFATQLRSTCSSLLL